MRLDIACDCADGSCVSSIPVPHPDNFNFAVRHDDAGLHFDRHGTAASLSPEIQRFDHSIYQLRLNPGHGAWAWEEPALAALLTPPEPCEAQPSSELIDARGMLKVGFGQHALHARFGVCGSSWLFDFDCDPEFCFYGMGEKWGSLEKTGMRTRYWNTDVWAEVPKCAIREGEADPVYASIPYVVVRKGQDYVGVLVDNGFNVFMATGARFEFHAPVEQQTTRFFLGAEQGSPSIFFIPGPSLAAVTEKLQRLVGVTPRPPLWALGHHQCRWGYRSKHDLCDLADKFTQHGIPNDGLWLDIDYMDGFRVFTLDRRNFPAPADDLASLAERGFRVVAILDPGVKIDPEYRIYQEGIRHGHFARTPEGAPFVGYVWPGRAHFPDFTQLETRAWWARHVSELAKLGFSGFWLDMNDPSVGAVSAAAMLFDQGRHSHQSGHNAYALGMCMASSQGLRDAQSQRRPFLLTRSASTSVGRFAAVWTGDNCSSSTFLRQCIPTTLNLALSGVPFNGPDVPGFGDDADADLIVRWYKAAFLFPFLRNHSCHDTRRQEPWAFDESTLRRVRRFIRLRYKLLPYLYQLFIAQERRGAAILRPLMYSSDDPEHAHTADAFFVGPDILQAPCLSRRDRTLKLPQGRFYDLSRGAFVEGGQVLRLKDTPGSTPVFVRDGALVPMQPGKRTDNQSKLDDIELHAVLSDGTASIEYEFDDGISLDYERGLLSRVHASLTMTSEGARFRVRSMCTGCGPLHLRLVLHGQPGQRAPRLLCHMGSEQRELPLRPERIKLTGQRLQVWRSECLTVS